MNKASAIEYLVAQEHLKTQQIAVFGNSRNDLSMFQIPNIYSVTYKTAKPYLIKIAKDVIDDAPSAFVSQGITDFLNYLNSLEPN
ncbi:HAD hydrolase family protein [bacterium]|nr:HAD hydrolase family protein [bacterium]